MIAVNHNVEGNPHIIPPNSHTQGWCAKNMKIEHYSCLLHSGFIFAAPQGSCGPVGPFSRRKLMQGQFLTMLASEFEKIWRIRKLTSILVKLDLLGPKSSKTYENQQNHKNQGKSTKMHWGINVNPIHYGKCDPKKSSAFTKMHVS